MINIPLFNGFEYAKEPYDIYIDDTLNMMRKYDIHEIGKTVQGRKMYGFSLGDMNKPTIYVEGNIHGGHEWRTCYWVRKFMDIIQNPEGYPQSSKINEIKANFSFYFIPACNPDGYENNHYTNANGVSLSRNFDYLWQESDPREGTAYYKGPYPFSEPESQAIRDVLIDIKPVSMVCCHSWGGFTGMMTRRPHSTRVYDVMLKDMYDSFYLSSKIPDGTDSAFRELLQSPSVYNWVGDKESSIGKKTIAMALETGTLETEYEQARLGLNGLYMHLLYVNEFIVNNENVLY